MSHHTTIGDTISCNAPYSVIGFRGRLFLRYPPSKACLWTAIALFYGKKWGVAAIVCDRGKKSTVYTTTMAPLFSQSVARPRGHRAKKTMVYIIFLGKQGKRVYTIGLERRVYTIEGSDPENEKRRVFTVVVYTFLFPVRYHRKHSATGVLLRRV